MTFDELLKAMKELDEQVELLGERLDDLRHRRQGLFDAYRRALRKNLPGRRVRLRCALAGKPPLPYGARGTVERAGPKNALVFFEGAGERCWVPHRCLEVLAVEESRPCRATALSVARA